MGTGGNTAHTEGDSDWTVGHITTFIYWSLDGRILGQQHAVEAMGGIQVIGIVPWVPRPGVFESFGLRRQIAFDSPLHIK